MRGGDLSGCSPQVRAFIFTFFGRPVKEGDRPPHTPFKIYESSESIFGDVFILFSIGLL